MTDASHLPTTIDLHHLGHPGAIASHRLGDVIVDPGCERTVGRVIDALGTEAPRAILLTHIHFDHAGGTGTLVERYPEVEVWVHELGARHLVDPTRLVASATAIYGDWFDALWGKVVAVPEANLRVLRGGERLGAWEVAYTPGHAKHHVSYLHVPTGTAFTGDVTGIRMGTGPVFPPTPPPDIDPPLWHASLETIAAWSPRRLAYSHFGQSTDVAGHLDALHRSLDLFTDRSARLDAAAMATWIRSWLAEEIGPDEIETYARASPPEGMWAGLDHYRRRAAAAGGTTTG